MWPAEGDGWTTAKVRSDYDVLAARGIAQVDGVFADQPETLNPRLFAENRERLPEAYMSMGETAENVADKYGITREEMDQYALQSHMRAVTAGQIERLLGSGVY